MTPMPAQACFLTLAVPVLNEATYIGACLQGLLAQIDPALTEILVLDGGSTDDTCAIVRDVAAHFPCVRLVHNPKRLQSAACNLAARLADRRSSVLMRADAHALYPPGFVRACLAALAGSGAGSVVVPMHTKGAGGFQRAVAAAQNSRLGNGGAAHRAGTASGFVDHGHHAAFDLAAFRRIGGYDEDFSHNEDAEFDQRVARAGGRVWMCREAAITYFPRATPWQLAQQYARHGAGRARTLQRHRLLPRPRQMVPPAVLAASLASLAVAPIAPAALAVPALYVAACLAWGALAALRSRDPWLLATGVAAVIMHMAWSVGFLRQSMRPVSSAHRNIAEREAF